MYHIHTVQQTPREKKNGEHAIIIIVVLYSMVNSDMHKAENNQNDRESGPAVVCRSSWDQSV